MKSKACLAAVAAIVGGSSLGVADAPAASAKVSASAAVKAEYRKVLLGEFFGPARAVCSQLTSDGVRSYTGGVGSCASVFASDQRAIALKLGGGTSAPKAAAAWRNEVTAVVAHLKVKVRRRRATTTDPSGVFHRTDLMEVGGGWKFTSAPPLPSG